MSNYSLRCNVGSGRKYGLVAGALACCFMLCVQVQVFAQSVPDLINYQGYLVDVNGVPIGNTTDGEDRFIRFTLYDAATGGTIKWGPQDQTTHVVRGQFNTIFGGKDASNRSLSAAFSSPDRYLAIKAAKTQAELANATEISPRQRVLSSPYAFESVHSTNSEKLAGIPGEDILASKMDGTVKYATKLNGAVNLSKGNYSGVYSTGDGSWHQVPNVTVKIKSSGRPVFVCLTSYGEESSLRANGNARIKIDRNGATVWSQFYAGAWNSYVLSGSFVDSGTIGSPGEYTYTLFLMAEPPGTAQVWSPMLYAFEL